VSLFQHKQQFHHWLVFLLVLITIVINTSCTHLSFQWLEMKVVSGFTTWPIVITVMEPTNVELFLLCSMNKFISKFISKEMSTLSVLISTHWVVLVKTLFHILLLITIAIVNFAIRLLHFH